jgi:sugar lactone lactonase YvrE
MDLALPEGGVEAMRARVEIGVFAVITVVLAGLSTPGTAAAQPFTFTHHAGSLGGPGSADGTGTAATFLSPLGIALGPDGFLYVAEGGNHRIRKISPAGVVTTLAGGALGYADGTGSSASFNGPGGVAVDSSGTVYVADTWNNRIRKVTPAGVVTTLAGSGTAAFADGTGTAASFFRPNGVAVDGSGNLVVADGSNCRIRRVTPAGVVTTIAGSGVFGYADGAAAAAAFNVPYGVAVDASGNVFVADTGNNRIRKVTPAGAVTTLAGSGFQGTTDGPGSTATINYPRAVAVDGSGNVWVVDDTSLVRKVTPAGVVSTFAGTGAMGGADGTGTAAAFSTPWGIAVDGAGNLYVADTTNNRIRKVSPAAVVTTLAGSGTAGAVNGTGTAASFYLPAGVAADRFGNVYVADTYNNRIRKIAPGGVVTTLAGRASPGAQDGPGATATFYYPEGVAVDGAGLVYVGDSNSNLIRKVALDGTVSTLAGSGDAGFADGQGAAASFDHPAGLAVDGAGNVYVADVYNNTIRKVTPGGSVTTFAGSGLQGAANGTGTAASFRRPAAVAVDAAGNLYVGDGANHMIRKITPGGVVTTLAGSGSNGSADGTGTAASFFAPDGVAVDPAGTVWVADRAAHAIRKVTPAGVVTTVGGSGTRGSADGIGTDASFFGPTGITVDTSGNLYVADRYNNAIRLGQPAAATVCTPGTGTLCLLGGRFKVTADYADYGGGRGAGKAVSLTADTGYFWFFDSANVEAVVKMVPFCGSGTDNVAVYAGGLTDLDVTLHVTDTRTGTTKDYRNPLGDLFTLIRDGPFDCPASPAAGEAGASFPEIGGDGIVETTAWMPAPPAPDAACTTNATTLCLLGGRFQVRAAYRDYAGTPGTGQAVGLTSDTGYFWFFRASNVEAVVKMVSFCGSGTNNVGIYAGGLTDVEVTLTVTDTLKGLVKSYTNALGTPFRLIRDGPFACP